MNHKMESSDTQPSLLPPPNRYATGTWICWVIILCCVGFVALLANLNAMKQTEQQEHASSHDTAAGVNMNLLMISRYSVGARTLLPMTSPEIAAKMLQNVDAVAKSRRDRICAAIIAGEISGADEALRRFAEIDNELEESEVPILFALHAIYRNSPEILNQEQQDALIRELGWHGSLALSFDRPAGDSLRSQVLDSATRTLIVVFVVIAIIGGTLLLGLGLLITATTLRSKDRLHVRFVPVPESGIPVPPVFLEAFAIYIAGYVLFSLVLALLVPNSTMSYSLIFTAALPFIVAWPIWRGMNWRETLRGYGWHRGGGIFKEIGCGIMGYVTGLPVIAVAFLVTIGLSSLAGVHPTHPVTEYFSLEGWPLAIIYFIACIWAPVMEETVFRGALYNHLRSRRVNWAISASLVGLIFAVIHPQGWTTIPVLGTIGAVLAGIREWRGSLIGPIAAHALSNATVTTIGVMLLGN